MTTRDRWLLLISVIMFIGVGVYYLRPQRLLFLPRKSAPQAVARPSVPQTLSPGVGGETFGRTEGYVVDTSTPWGRNPFLTAEEEARSKSFAGDGLQVKALIVGRPKSVATIDGHIVMVGDKIGEETVREIRPDGVVLEREGQKRVLRVSQPAIEIQVRKGRR